MKLEVLADAEAAAERAAALLAGWIRDAVDGRGRAVVALSGGSTPVPAFRRLAELDLPWQRVEIVQVDERAAPPGDEARNATVLRRELLDRVGAWTPEPAELGAGPAAAPAGRGPAFHPMPVEEADLEAAARRYADRLERLAGSPPVIDVVHLGLGADGHTASLVPGDPAVDERLKTVAATGPYEGHRRLTLTLPVLDAARRRLWLVVGARKREALEALIGGSAGSIAARVRSARSVVVADTEAAGR